MANNSTQPRRRIRAGRMAAGYFVLTVATAMVYFLSRPMGEIPALGPLLDPISGCWANAEPVNKDFNDQLKLPALSARASVWFDDQLTPHIKAANDHDLYFLQGYVHAWFRLWQMDMQTRAAAGRVSEVAGEKSLVFDRRQRRKGMVYAAERSLAEVNANPQTRDMVAAYTAGINAYIAGLSRAAMPLEYKLMGFTPEPWTPLKSVLLIKYMADDLSGKTDDIAHSWLRRILSKQLFEFYYPDKIPGATPVIPAGTAFAAPSLQRPPAPSDSLAFPKYTAADFEAPRVEGKGSNNWALSGSRTASGAPILCNDPHLALNLPSLWFKVQLMAPGINVYGASLPGAPGVIIGFNDNMSWGLTNNYRDVKDYYEISPVAGDKTQYWFNGRKVPFTFRYEKIGIKGKPDFIDTVRYSLHGPLMYERNYFERGSLMKPLAVRWMGHEPTNEFNAIYLLNRARDYNEYTGAIQHFLCPAQNIIYADRKGNIALWGQGRFVNKWTDQGRFVMHGRDSSTLWQQFIPTAENPHALNPAQGFLSSANQLVTDSTYPYWYNGDYNEIRAWRINQVLAGMRGATIKDMFALQNDDYSVLAATVLPTMLQQISATHPYIKLLSTWDYHLSKDSEAPTVFQVWWHFYYRAIWSQYFRNIPFNTYPLPERTMQLVVAGQIPMRNTGCDTTNYARYCNCLAQNSFKDALDSMSTLKKKGAMAWHKAKNTSVTHLTKIPAFSYDQLPTGGWGNTVNAMRPGYGPSWRMVVQMGKEIEAWGIYPGGQSGNPGSRYYGDYINEWAQGKYHRLVFLPNANEQQHKQLRYKWNIEPSK